MAVVQLLIVAVQFLNCHGGCSGTMGYHGIVQLPWLLSRYSVYTIVAVLVTVSYCSFHEPCKVERKTVNL